MKKLFSLFTLALLSCWICIGQDYSNYLTTAQKALKEGRYEQAVKNAKVYKKLTGTNRADNIINEAQAHIQHNAFVDKARESYFMGNYNDALTSYIGACEFLPDEALYIEIEKCSKVILESNKITTNKTRGEKLYKIFLSRKSTNPVEESLNILRLASLCQDGNAATVVGKYFEDNKNYDEAIKYYEVAKASNINVFSNLAYCYYKQSELDNNNKSRFEELAFENYKIAAEKNDAIGQRNLGWCYQYGIGTHKDLNEARHWYEKAYQNGHKKAKEMLDNLNVSEKNIQETVVTAGNITVSGYVQDKKGEPIVGAAIILKGTSIGTVTGINGEYTLKDVPSNGTLEFYCIGYKTSDKWVNGKSNINVILQKPNVIIDVWNDITSDDPIAGISAVSDFSKYPFGLKGDMFWGPFHLGVDASFGLGIIPISSISITSNSSISLNGNTIQPTVEFIGSEVKKTLGTFAYTISPGIFYKYVSLDCGIGQIFTKTYRTDTYKYIYETSESSTGDTSIYTGTSTERIEKKTVETKNSFFVLKPGLSGVIGNKDEWVFILSARYRICPKDKSLNGFELSIGAGFPF